MDNKPLRVWIDPTAPVQQMPTPLALRGSFVGWPDGADRTPSASSDDLRAAIARSVNQHIPNEFLASFGRDDVVVATDGLFWITPDWNVEPLPPETESKVKQVMNHWA